VPTSGGRSNAEVSKRTVGAQSERLTAMIILGIILLIAGFLLKISILWTIGIILLVIGVILAILGAAGRTVGGRRHYF
jgi:hypothetical protein